MDDVVFPTAIIEAPNQIGACGNLKLDASLSSGGAGRPLTFKWSIKNTQYFRDTSECLSVQNSQKPSLILSGQCFRNHLFTTNKFYFITAL